MIIGDTQFEFVDAIEPDRDSYGHIVEHSLASRYANRAKLSLNKYGEGPFCPIPGSFPVTPVLPECRHMLGFYRAVAKP